MVTLGPAATLAPPPGSVPGIEEPAKATEPESDGSVPGALLSAGAALEEELSPNMALSTSPQLARPRAAAAKMSVKTRCEPAIFDIALISARAVCPPLTQTASERICPKSRCAQFTRRAVQS